MDARVPMDGLLEAFGVPVTVTPPCEDAIETIGAWILPSLVDTPIGVDLHRRERQRVLALSRDAIVVDGVSYPGVSTVPLKTRIDAPEMLGDTPQAWLVDGFEDTDRDHHRPRVVPLIDEP